MDNRFEPLRDRTDRLDRLVAFLIIALAILVVKDCYAHTHRSVCQCRGANSEGLYNDTDAAGEMEPKP